MAITIRIDEFSNPSDIDGALSTEEQTRFLTFGFDIELAVPPVIFTPNKRLTIVKPEKKQVNIKLESRFTIIKKENRFELL